jgi:hypothetical protein
MKWNMEELLSADDPVEELDVGLIPRAQHTRFIYDENGEFIGLETIEHKPATADAAAAGEEQQQEDGDEEEDNCEDLEANTCDFSAQELDEESTIRINEEIERMSMPEDAMVNLGSLTTTTAVSSSKASGFLPKGVVDSRVKHSGYKRFEYDANGAETFVSALEASLAGDNKSSGFLPKGVFDGSMRINSHKKFDEC